MSTAFHPMETTLVDLARGGLKPGARLVMRAHLESCAACRADLQALEAAGGVLMADLDPVALEADALAHALARIELPLPPPAPKAPPIKTALLDGIAIPDVLQRAAVGPTRWIAPGIRVAKLPDAGAGECTYLLRVKPGLNMPQHGHRGQERTLVLAGTFSDSAGVYHVGDLAEACEADVHQPVVGGDRDCVCLIAADGVMRVHDWLPRLLQPFFGV